jgi:prefoldin subunit 5
MALFKELKELKEKLKYYQEMIPVNNMGKLSRSVAIESYTKKISKLENEIKKLKENDKK